MTVASRVATAGWRLASARSARRFAAAVVDPAAAQQHLLTVAAERVAATARGRELGVDARQHADRERWRAEVPIATFEDHRPWIDRIAAGEHDVLAPGGVRCMEPTGGTSGVEKLVPVNDALLAQFAAATTPWIRDLLDRCPQLRSGRAYWAVSPPARAGASCTTGGVPIGLEHDSDYLPRVLARLVDATLGLPRATSRVRDLGASRHVTLLALLAMPDLAMISVWSPSFLTLLAAELDERWPLLLEDLGRGRIDASVDVGEEALRRELERAIGAHPRRARELAAAHGVVAPPRDLQLIWPRLALVSCWTDAQAARALPAMVERVPRVQVQPKGLLATEGVTSIPWRDAPAPVLAVASHVVELLPVGSDDGAAAFAPHELEPGQRAEVLLTTAGGLTRYRTFDVVECVGHAPGSPTPAVRFVGRADHASDLAGEKLTPDAVQGAIDRAAAGVDPGFTVLLPDVAGSSTGAYALVVDAARHDEVGAERFATALDAELRALHHYALCRDLGQLSPVRAVRVDRAERAWERACLRLGQRAGSRKDTALDPRVEVLPLLLAAD